MPKMELDLIEEANPEPFAGVDFNNCSVFKKQPPIQLSECRELVLVPGGISEKIRILTEQRPEFCWKYASSSLLIMYHFNEAMFDRSLPKPRGRPQLNEAKLETFYGYVNHKYSPYEFYIQPKPMDAAKQRMQESLNQIYNIEAMDSLTKDELYTDVPCVTEFKGQWHRARVTWHPVGVADPDPELRVQFVDWGSEAIVKLSKLKPLKASLARLPPMALFCRMHGVSVNDLEIHKVYEFQDLMNSDSVLNVVKVELLTTSEPYLVNLYHPTIAKLNLGRTFYPRPPPPPPEPPGSPPTTPKPKKEPVFLPPDCSDSEDYYSSEEEEPPDTRGYLLSYERMAKPVTKTEMKIYISHVENARFVYVHDVDHRRLLGQMQERLKAIDVDALPNIPERMMRVVEEMPCLVNSDQAESGWLRALVREVKGEMLIVQAVDYGWSMEVGMDGIKALPREFDMQPMMWCGRLTDLCDEYPWWTETRILRSLLDSDTLYTARFDKRTHGPPFRLKITFPTEQGDEEPLDLVDLVEEIKANENAVRSQALVPYDPEIGALAVAVQDPDFHYEVFCCRALAKGLKDYTHVV